MNKINNYFKIMAIIGLFCLSTMMLISIQPVTSHTAQPTTAASCSNPTVTKYVQAGTQSQSTAYNVSEIDVPKDTCVIIFLKNIEPDIIHDFTIDATSDFGGIQITVDNSTADYGSGGLGINNATFMTPNKDMSLQFYCSQPGHKDAGMVGTLYVGSKPSSPGFEFPVLIITFVFVGTVVTIRKKNNRKQ